LADLKLIGGIGLNLDQLMRDSQTMSRVFGKQYKLMISTQGYDVVKKQLRDLVLENEKLQKLNTRVLKQTIDSNGMMKTTTLNRDGVKKTTTLDTNTGQIVKEIRDADSALTELNKSYGRIKKAQTEIGQIQKEYAGREKEMPASSQKRLVALNNILAREQAYVNTKRDAIRNDEKMNALLQDRKRIQYQIDHKTEKVTQTTEVEKVNTLYAEQSRLVKEIGQLQREMFSAGPKERKVIEGTLATRQQELAQVQQQISQSGYQNTEKEAAAQKQIRIEAQKTAQEEARLNDQRVRGKQALDTMYRTMVAMLTIQAVRMLRDAWREALSFVKQYYDALNEIRIVTGYTQEQADKLADRYLKLADKMKVSALDISKMGATLYRQGLQGDDAVMGRMEAVIKYSKIAAEDVSESADLMVVAINAFQRKGEDASDTAMRVADTWTYMGDAVETEAGEIGTAMQKVVANAKVVGLSLEKTSSFIATISSATRETPEVVGTALNRIISRYEKLTQAGMNKIFTSEDGDIVAVNDVARALKVINVELYTAGEGFMTFGDVMDKVGAKWKDLSDVEQRYLATAMAGIHGINKFYALMEDYDKSLSLYEGSLNAKGSANAKYAIEMESVTAAQADMTNSLQALYNTLLSGQIIKEFYEWVAKAVNNFKSGVEVLGDFNIKAVATAATIIGVGVAIGKVIKVMSDAAKAKSLLTLFGGGSIRTLLVGLTALATVLITVAGKVREASDPIKSFTDEMERLSGAQEKWNEKIDRLAGFKTELENIAIASKDTAEYQETFNGLMENLVKNTPSLSSALQDAKGNWVDLGTAIGVVNERMEKNAELRDLEARANAFRALSALPSELEGSIGDSRKAEKLKTLVEAMKFLRDNQDLSNWADGFFKMGNNGAGARDINNFTSQQAEAYKSKVLVNTFADNDGGALDYISSYFGFNKNLSLKPNRNALVNMIAEDLELSSAMIDTLYSNSKDEVKIKVMEYQDAIVKIFSTTDGYREAPLFVRNMIDQVAKDMSEEFGNIDFSVMSDDEIVSIANSYKIQTYEKAKSIMEDAGSALIKVIAGSSSPSRPPFSTAVEELTQRFGGDLLETQKVLDKYFPAEYSEKYWTEFMKRVYSGYSDQNLDDFLGKGDSPFDFLKQETARGLKEAGEVLGVAEEEIQGAFDKIMAVKLDPAGKETAALSSLFNLLFNGISPNQMGTLLDQLEQTEEGISGFAATWTEWTNLSKTSPFSGSGEQIKTVTQIYDELRKVSTDSKVSNAAKTLLGLFDGVTNAEGLKTAAAEARGMFENLVPPELQGDLANLLPNFDTFLDKAEEGKISLEYLGIYTKNLQSNINDLDFKILLDSISEMEGSGKIIGGVADALKGIKAGGVEAVTSVISLRNTMNSYADAQKAYNEIIKAGGKLNEDTSGYFDTLSSATGIPVELLDKDITLASTKLNAEMEQLKNTMSVLAKMGGANIISSDWIGQIVAMEGSTDPAVISLQSLLDVIELITGATFNGASSIEDVVQAIENLTSTTGEDIDSWFYKLRKLNEEIKAMTEGSYGGMKQDMFRESGAYNKAESLMPYMGYMKDESADTRDYGAEAFSTAIRELSLDEIEVMKSEFPELGAIIEAVFDNGTYSAEELEYAMEKTREKLDEMAQSAEDSDLSENFGDALGDFKELQKGGKNAAKVISDITSESKGMTKALSAMEFIQKKQYKTQDELNEAYQAMSDYLGIPIETAEDFAAAQAMMAGATLQTGNSLGWMVNGLMALSAIQIDPSGKVSAMGSLEAAAAAAGMSTEEFAIALAAINGAGFNFKINEDGTAGVVESWVNKNAIKNFAPSMKSSGGGGGGGGGGSGQSEIQKFLDQLSQLKSIDDFLRKMVQMRGSLYEARGELTNYIQAVEQEIEVVKARNDVDEAELQQIDERMRAQQELVASMSTSNKNYEKAASDLKSLQDTHQSYTETVEQNKIDLEELNDTLEETRNAIRDMQIDIRETIHEAIVDREELNQSMLEGEIELQDTILEILEARYQKEWDLIKENIDAQKQALEEEKRLIDEELNARKEAAEKADKYTQLRGYESQLAIISADPTRAKDQLELRKKIAGLRKDIAWDLAEDEAEAQKDGIDQQIKSLDEYLEEIDAFYEALFENPQQLIEEMREVMKGSNEEILEWLETNSTEFASSTAETQENMRIGWQATLDQMRGFTKTYWDEVEEIISQGDTAIIEFLKANSAEYRTAGKMQAEALVDEWQKKLDDLKAALTNTYQRINEMPTDKYVTIHVSTVENGGGGGKTPIDPLVVAVGGGGNFGMSQPGKVTQMAFASGGLVDYTGTAQVHGSPTNPEAFLSAVDTKMIRGLLDGFKFIVPRFGGIKSQTGANGNVTIEEINISVDKLDNDADLEDLANKVGEKFAKAMTVKRGVSVGNLRIK
jgi:TP901 family phage tail tape measure protein